MCRWERGNESFLKGVYNTRLNASHSPAVPMVLLTSPGMVWALFSFTEQPKSPSLIRPDDVRKMLAPTVRERGGTVRGRHWAHRDIHTVRTTPAVSMTLEPQEGLITFLYGINPQPKCIN